MRGGSKCALPSRRQILAGLAACPMSMALRPEAALAQQPIVRLDRLLAKGINFNVRQMDVESWRRAAESDPRLPRTPDQLRRLWRDLTAHRRGLFSPLDKGVLTGRAEECGEEMYTRFFAGLRNPLLGLRERAELEAMMDEDIPAFDQSLETEHFVLKWATKSPHAPDNIADPAIVKETSGYLEAAWARYLPVFGRSPYLTPDTAKIEVVFNDIGGIGSTTPDGPIMLDSALWQNEPGVRQPTSAHELFHRMQYAFGFRTTHPNPSNPYAWFSEGTASWAEVLVWQRVSRDYKIVELFETPDIDLFQASYRALPFWLFFDTHQSRSGSDIPLVDYLRRYEASGKQAEALAGAIAANPEHRDVDSYFAWFSRERRTGRWRTTPSGSQPYPTILGPDGKALSPVLTVTEAPVSNGATFTLNTGVSKHGSDYYHFTFAADDAGSQLRVTVTGVPGGDYAYSLMWEKGATVVSTTFPSTVTGDFSFSETVDPAVADGLVLIISGRSAGGDYGVSATLAKPSADARP